MNGDIVFGFSCGLLVGMFATLAGYVIAQIINWHNEGGTP